MVNQISASMTAMQLTPLVLDNNTEAFAILRAKLLKFARSMRIPYQLAEEALEMTMLDICNYGKNFLDANAESRYVYKAFYSNYLKLRSRYKNESNWDVGTAQNLPDKSMYDPIHGLEYEDLVKILEQVFFEVMGSQEETILRAKYLQDLTNAEIAHLIDRSEHHVRAILSRSRQKLIAALQAKGIDVPGTIVQIGEEDEVEESNETLVEAFV